MQTVDYVKQLRDEGRKEGRDEGRKEMLLGFYRARFGAVPREVRAAVDHAQDESTLTAWVEVFATQGADEILAALTAKKVA